MLFSPYIHIQHKVFSPLPDYFQICCEDIKVDVALKTALIQPLCSFVVRTCMCTCVRGVGVRHVLSQSWFIAKKRKQLECKEKDLLMEGDIKCHGTQCRKSPIAGQSSEAERGHMRVVRSVVDRGEWWSHPTPSLGSPQRNKRSKTAEKILSSTRYLPVTWHHQSGV